MADFQKVFGQVKSFFSRVWQKLKSWNRQLKKRPFLNIVVKVLGALFLLIFVPLFLLITAARIGVFGGMPSTKELKEINNPEGSEVIADDGKTILGRYYLENRTNTTYDSLSPKLIEALIATEDIRYYEHNGIDWKSWARVLWRTLLLREKSSGGGSTISQQLAKNLYKRRTYWRGTTLINKIREIIIAQRLEKMYSKEELLTLYFNTVSFGGNVFGIEVAAKQYFNTTPKNLKYEEAATLVGMLKATTKYNPLNNLKLAKDRRNTVLSKMEKYKFLTKQQTDSLSLLPINLQYIKESHTEGIATYFREHVRIDLEKALANVKKNDGSDYNEYSDGLKIYTSINYKMQEYAEKAVAKQIAELQKIYNEQLGWINKPWNDTAFLHKAIMNTERYKWHIANGKSEKFIDSAFNHKIDMEVYSAEGPVKKKMSPKDSLIYYLQFLSAGFLAAEPQTGFIKAWVGGIDNHFFQYDHVKARRHVGSTFKPIVYSTALEKGFNPCDYYSNQQKTYKEYDDWSPKNYEGGYGGSYSMTGALKRSLNCVSVDLIMKTGIDSVVMYGNKLGITTDIPHEPAIALGAVDVSLLDMMTVYATIADKGMRPKLTYIVKVVNRNGEVLIDNTLDTAQHKTQVLSEETATIMRRMMEKVVNEGTAGSIRWASLVKGELAGKTGTTQDNADGWFIGFNPNLIAGAWVGGEFPEIHLTGGYTGANTALPIVGAFLHEVEKDKELNKYMAGKFDKLTNEQIEKLTCADIFYDPKSDTMAVDSTMVDSLGNPIIVQEPDKIDQIIPENEKSKSDSTKKGFFNKLFKKKEDEDDAENDPKKVTNKDANKSKDKPTDVKPNQPKKQNN